MTTVPQTPRDFDQRLADLHSTDLATRWNAVVALARHPVHLRGMEAWYAIEPLIEDEPSKALRGIMAQALSMIGARTRSAIDKMSIFHGRPIPDFLLTYEQHLARMTKDPTPQDWDLLDSGTMTE